MTVSSFLDAVLVDEVGIERGCVAGFLLKSIYQPVFSRHRDALRIVAFDASIRVERMGEMRSIDDLADASRGVDADFLAGLRQTLEVGNHRNLSLPGCELFLGHNLSQNSRLRQTLLDAARRAGEVGEAVIESSQVICRISSVGSVPVGDRPGLLGELHEGGFCVSFDLFDGADGGAEMRYRPDVAEISGSWLAKIASETPAARLLRPLVEAHRREGTRIFARGIASAEHLQLAIDAGVDYLAGDYLAPAALAGTMVAEDPLPLGNLLQMRSPVSRSA